MHGTFYADYKPTSASLIQFKTFSEYSKAQYFISAELI